MKVYLDEANGDEWYIGPSARQVVAWLRAEQEIEVEVTDLRELTQEELDTMKFVDPDDGSEVSFAQHREDLMSRDGQTFPDFFASRED